jgi:hypothetical protein
MKKLLGFLIVILIYAFCPIKAEAQGYEEWIASVGDEGPTWESGTTIALDSEGNVYSWGSGIGGWSGTTLVKYNGITGAQEWLVQISNLGANIYGRKSIIVDSGYVYIAGGGGGSGIPDIVAAKYDATTGSKVWNAWYDPILYSSFCLWTLALDHGGNLYVGGYHGERWLVLKYDSTGVQKWEAFDYNLFGLVKAMAVDAAGDVYVTGEARYGLVSQSGDYFTIKYEGERGTVIWCSTYDGPRVDSRDYPTDIAIDLEGNIYVTGPSQGQSGLYIYDYATVKYDPEGNELWVARYNGQAQHSTIRIALDAVGNVHVSGHCYGTGSGKDYLTLKYNPQGEELWAARYTNLAFPNSEDEAKDMALDPFGNVYVTGKSEQSDPKFNLTTVKYNSSGELQWVVRTGTTRGPQYSSEGADIAVNAEGVYVTGHAQIRVPFHRDTFVTVKYPLEIPNQPPVANAGPGQIITDADLSGSEIVTLDGSASYDPDTGDTIGYVWEKNEAIIGNEVNFDKEFALGEHLVTLTVFDNVEVTDSDTTIITILEGTPAGAIDNLISVIQDMNLHQGISNSLDKKLERIRASLDAVQAGNRQDAIHLLQSCILECEAQRGRILTNQQADYLIYKANLIIAFLER